jgi:predicted RNA-binding protein
VCEFTVLLDGKTVFKDVVYAKADSSNVITRDVLGESKTFRNCRIIEVDVNSTRLLLSSAQK